MAGTTRSRPIFAVDKIPKRNMIFLLELDPEATVRGASNAARLSAGILMTLMDEAKRGRRYRLDETEADLIRPLLMVQRFGATRRQKHTAGPRRLMAGFVLILSSAWLSWLSIGA
jgi:hypothetical protein